MNIVDAIRSQVSDEQLRHLGGLVGGGAETARTAVNAAVPSLLAALGQLATGDGVARVINALTRFAPGSADSRSAGNAPDQARQGVDLLSSLFGQGGFDGLVNALTKFGGLGQDGMRQLLGWLAPVVLSGIARQFTGPGRIDSQGVASFFQEQRRAIDNALPMGFSPAEVLGAAAPQQPSSSPARWFVPVAALAVLAAAGIFYFNRNGPTLNVPTSPAEVRPTVLDSCKSLTAQLDKIKDLDSARSAVPELKKVAGQFAAMKPVADKMTPADKEKVKEAIEGNAAKLDEQCARLAWVPGAEEQIKPAVEEVLEKMAALAGTKPQPRISNVSAELARTFTTLTESMGRVKDAATAAEALPKFKAIEGQIDQSKAAMDKLPEAGKAKLAELVKPQLDQLRQAIEKMLAQNGVGEKVKPTIDAILAKLNTMVG